MYPVMQDSQESSILSQHRQDIQPVTSMKGKPQSGSPQEYKQYLDSIERENADLSMQLEQIKRGIG